jgi:hypothetical protein
MREWEQQLSRARVNVQRDLALSFSRFLDLSVSRGSTVHNREAAKYPTRISPMSFGK